MNKVIISTTTTKKKVENINNHQPEITELKNIINGMKIKKKRLNSRLDQTEERISKLEDKAVEFIHSEEPKEKRVLTPTLNSDAVEKFHYKCRLQAMLPPSL